MAGPTQAVPGRIFISYRREETAYPAGWLYTRLAEHFGATGVFKDVDSIQLGDDFVEVITTAVGSCDVLLALIGEEWLTITDEVGRPRLDDQDDFVRLEIEAALTRNVRVIPVLVDGASMPRADLLPGSLGKLVRRQALELSASRFEFDTNRLLKVLDWTLAEVRTAQDAPPTSTPGEPATTRGQEAPVPGAAGPPSGHGPSGGRGHRLSRRARVLAAVGGLAVGLPVVAVVAYSQLSGGGDSALPSGLQAIEVVSAPVTSGHGIRLTEVRAGSSHSPPRVGDTVAVAYSLTNVTDDPVRLSFTFVGVRNAADAALDTEATNEGTVLSPGETVRADGRRLLDSPGAWTFWPCYETGSGQSCPDEWQAFFLIAK
ncbi:MAG: toll/interleukin-1 receptor domain-containing protein [Actinomycetes bacterium]